MNRVSPLPHVPTPAEAVLVATRAVRRWPLLSVIASCSLFVVLTAVAMASYSGGTEFNHASHGYAFFGNVFSDLGMGRSWDGSVNLVSRVLFSTALASLALSVILAAPIWGHYVEARAGSQRARWATVATVVVSATAFAGIALAPADSLTDVHNTCVNVAFSFLVLFLAQLGWHQWHDRDMRIERMLTVATGVVVLGYFVVEVIIRDADVATRITIHSICQKILVYVALGDLLAQTRALHVALSKVGGRAHQLVSGIHNSA